MSQVFEILPEAEKARVLRHIAAHQPSLFPPQGKTGQVYQEGGRWIAVIDDGWCVGQGKTKNEAVRKAIENYEKEMSGL